MRALYTVRAVWLSLLLLCGAMSTQAATLQGAELYIGDSGEIYSAFNAPGGFTNSWTFTLKEEAAVKVFIDQFEFITLAGPVVLISGLSGSIDSWSGLDFTTDVLSAGEYTLEVSGTVTGSAGGVYAGTLSAIPLPAAAWLLGSALLGLTLVSRRQQKNSLSISSVVAA